MTAKAPGSAMNKSERFAIGLLTSLGLVMSAHAADYDLVINGGRVMDPETKYDAVANVGIKGGRIAVITRNKISGKETINAKGLVVAPGFIDTHFHALDPFATKLALRDGVTTGMDLETGSLHVAAWYDKRAKEGWQVNYGATQSFDLCRLLVHDPEVKSDPSVDVKGPVDYSSAAGLMIAARKDGKPGYAESRSSLAQMNEIMQCVDEGLREGALGIGVGLAYQARGVQSYEMYEAQRTAARYRRLASVHTRFHLSSVTPTEATIGLDEVLANALLLDAPLLLAHDNDYGWWENEEKLQKARAKGYNMWGEYYPYDAGMTSVGSEFLRPAIWIDTYGNKYEETLYDPQTDKFLTRATYDELVAKDPGRLVVVYSLQRRKWIDFWLRTPEMVVATDAALGFGRDGRLLPWDADYSQYAGHPRTAGANAKVLRLGREQGVPLMFAISQLSYWTARHLGDTGLEAMKQRGRVQVGKIADLTLFDPKTVKDNATYKAGENGLPSTGMPYVIVSGTVVVRDSKVLPVKPGQPIRFPVEAKGRFEPVEVNKWLGEYTIGMPKAHELDDSGAGMMSKGK